jgi:hypothetical protein
MFECTFCDISFEDKKLFLAHQKTKKCIIHRHVKFSCDKCLKTIKGYDNTLRHVENCKQVLSEKDQLIAYLNGLSDKFELTLKFETETSGSIDFKKINKYVHPKKFKDGVNIPQKFGLFRKALNKYSDEQFLGSHNLYLNDTFHKIFRISEGFQFLAVKCTFEELFVKLWCNSNMFYFKDETLYVLGKVQCENEEGQKWFGDTFVLKENEKIVKCVWFKDPDVKRFFLSLSPLLKDILNLYLNLANWALKQKKIKFKGNLTQEKRSEITNKINETMVEYSLTILVDNIQKFYNYGTFCTTFHKIVVPQIQGLHLPSNVQHIFKDDLLPQLLPEEFSLMSLNDPDLAGGNFDHLMEYILPECEKEIFRSKK